jgi:glucose-6-phosphate 1-dehydrogenase
VDPTHVVRGQYRGYRAEAGVAADSQVESFAALRLHIDTWRWAGVPFYVRTGKCLPITATEVIVTLKRAPLPIFGDITPADPNYLRFRLSPEVVISLGARVKYPGEEMRGEAAQLVARHLLTGEDAPYERLLGDALRGDATLFTRADNVEAAWRVIDPILTTSTPLLDYEPGTWGPAAAAAIVAGGDGWHDPQAEATDPC